MAFICLVLHLTSATVFGPLATTVLALLDSDHSVRLSASAEGVTLVLGHERATDGAGFLTDHCLLAQCLVTLAVPTSNQASDHLICFTSCDGLISRSAVAARPSIRWGITPAFLSSYCSASARILSRPVLSPRASRPDTSHSISLLRTSVLLI